MNKSETAYILASGSPRRKELLAYLGLPQTYNFVVETDETIEEDWGPAEAVVRLAINKGTTVLANLTFCKEQWHLGTKRVALISADTIVVCDNDILGKPKNEDDAYQMLSRLQGRSHEVYTGLLLIVSEHPLAVEKQNQAELAAYAQLIHSQLNEKLEQVQEKQSFGQIGEFVHFHELKSQQSNIFAGYICSRVTFRPLTDEQIYAYIKTGDSLDKAGSYGIQGIGAVNIESIDGDFYSVMGLPVSMLHHFIDSSDKI